MKNHFAPHLRPNAEVFIPKMTQNCPDCGCACARCFLASNQLDIHHQVAAYEARISELTEKNLKVENELLDAKTKAQVDYSKLQEEHARLRDRYERLYDSHKKMNQLNQNFEEKLLAVVERYEAEKRNLSEQIRDADERTNLSEQRCLKLQGENTRLRADCRLAVSLLRNNPHLFVAQRFSALSGNIQQRVLRNSPNIATSDTTGRTANDHDRSHVLQTIDERNSNGYLLHSENLICTYPPTVAISMFHSDASGGNKRAARTNSQQRATDLTRVANGSGNGNAASFAIASSRERGRESANCAGDDPLVPASVIADAIVHDYDAFQSESEADVDQFVASGFAMDATSGNTNLYSMQRSPDLIPVDLESGNSHDGRTGGRHALADGDSNSSDLDLDSYSDAKHGSPASGRSRIDAVGSGSVQVI